MSVITPCPFCGSDKLTWIIPAYSRRVTPMCEDCEARGPSGTVKDVTDRDLVNAQAISLWNQRVQP